MGQILPEDHFGLVAKIFSLEQGENEESMVGVHPAGSTGSPCLMPGRQDGKTVQKELPY